MEMDFGYKEEILRTRVGNLGGSDSNMLSQIALLGEVPKSAMERLAICKGLYAKEEGFKTAQMVRGDELEMEIFNMLKEQDDRWVSNPKIESKKFSRKNAKLMCHIDFLLVDFDKKLVTFIEAKATNKDIQHARRTYQNQLFQEYLIGKEYAQSLGKGYRFNLKLCHYPTAEDDGIFYPEKIELATVRFSRYLFDIGKAMDITDDYLERLTEYYPAEIVEQTYLPDNVKQKFEIISNTLLEIEKREKEVEEFKQRMYELMVDKDIKSIKCDAFNLTRVDPTKSYSFDTNRFKETHSTLYKRFLRESNKKGYIKLSLKKSE